MTTTKLSKEEKSARLLANVADIRVKKWCIFRGSSKFRTCRLTTLYKTKAEATEQARNLAQETFIDGQGDFVYFVAHIEAEIGFIGKEMFDRSI